MAHNLSEAKPSKLPLKIFISLSCFAITFLLTESFGQLHAHPDVVLGIGASLFVAGVAFILQFLYDLERRLGRMELEYSRHAGANEQRINEGFQKINEATKLFSLVEASALKTDAMTQLVSNSVRVRPDPPLVFELAQSQIQRLSDQLKSLGDEGGASYDGEDRDWLLGLTTHAGSTIDATSTTVDAGGHDFLDGSVWQSDLGQRYLEAQREAIRRGVRVRRLFILDRTDLRDDPKFRRLVQIQQDMAIEVRVLDPSVAPAQFIPPVLDLIIFDGTVCYQSTPTAQINGLSRSSIASTQLFSNRQRVVHTMDRFNDLWQLSKQVEA
jgi:hypothetical protein